MLPVLWHFLETLQECRDRFWPRLLVGFSVPVDWLWSWIQRYSWNPISLSRTGGGSPRSERLQRRVLNGYAKGIEIEFLQIDGIFEHRAVGSHFR